MNHAVTIGEILKLLAILAGLVVAAIGVAEWFASGMSDNAAEGEKVGRHGCAVFVVGAALIAVALLLAGCATPPVHDRIVEVDKPVAVQPITLAQVPVVPAPLGPRPPTLPQAADALLAKVCEFVGYAVKADPLLRISAGGKPVELQLYPECEKRK